MWVLKEGGALIGLVQPRGDEINGLWVHPDRQSTGAGTLLLQAGEEIIRRGGHQRAWLTCSGFNGSALAFYRRCGDQETQRTARPTAAASRWRRSAWSGCCWTGGERSDGCRWPLRYGSSRDLMRHSPKPSNSMVWRGGGCRSWRAA